MLVLRDDDVFGLGVFHSDAALGVRAENQRLLERKLLEEGRGRAVPAGHSDVEHRLASGANSETRYPGQRQAATSSTTLH